ncbi:furin-like protease kpc-1 isoform X2 [Chironomus tepperi]|uniref:furin-like protease kpc-1 isoform X2 n=1 Tax=Chironomus tepperi TaxID=113505 RepID=UPI00391FA62D
MSNDEVRWCDNEKKNDRIDSTTSDNVNASYTFLSVYHINNNNIVNDDKCNNDDDQISVINIHKHRNIHIKRDSRHNYNFYDDYDNSTVSATRSTCQHHHSHPKHDQHQKHSSTYSRKYYQIVNVCFIIMLHVLCNFLVTSVNCDELMESVGARGHFTHTWAVHIPGGEDVAKLVAEDHGMIFRGRIIDDHYHMEHRSIAKRSISPAHHHQRRLNEDNRVVWSKQQTAKSRQKRDFTRLKPKSISKLLNDPKWSSMWYLNRGDGLDMNVVPAWREGITGKGVVVTILDDGLETDHPDLERNYDPEASWDVNSHDADPMPHYDMTDSNRHGTRCAGEVAATANNSLCAVGIAYSARVGGVRMLDGDVTDSVEAMSLGLNPQHIDIYSASWGPDDDGKTVDGPGEMATKAFIDGVTKGRGGKGSIFVWASGNGGREQDNCNCDGYTNSIWTLSISSATEFGDIPWYSEKCSSTLATTYSSGQQNEKQVVTTDLHHMCTSSHTGTSASAPLAAGIVALGLEANPNLTWRDMQHIVVRTANPANLGKSSNEWTVNGVGRKVSHSFGYGLMDAAAMVRLARVWETVPEQQRCEIHSPHLDKPIPPKRNVTFTLKVDHCKGVNFLEHVQARITLTTQRRGDIVIYLTSPSGTRTCLLTERVHDISRSGFGDWPFMTVHQWGEAPHGTWELEIHNKGRYMGQITQWNLIFYGTSDPPQRNDPPRYPSGNNKKTVNDFIHNSLENSQWGFITQDVAEMGSHSDVQRTVDDDLTSSACLHYSDNNKSFCLECAHQTFIFDGRCYNTCPERSFIVPEKISENIESKGLSVKKRRHAMNIDEFDSLDDIIGKTNRAISSSESSITPQKLCGSCHDVCLKCNGPTENDCLTCDSDYNQIIIGSRIICHRKSNDDENSNLLSTTTTMASEIVNDGNKSVLNSITNQLKNYSIEKIVLISSMIGILLMIISICIYLLYIKCDCDILSTVYGKTKQLLCRASVGNSTGAEREKYSYNIVEMEERSPLTTVIPDSQILHDVYHDDDDDEDSDISES